VEPIQVLYEAVDSITSVVVSETEIITSSVDGLIRNYDVRTGVLSSDTIGAPVTCVNLSHDKNCILASSLDGSIRLLDKAEGELLGEFKGHSNSSYKIESCLSLDDAYVFSGSEDGIIYVWDLVESNIVAKLRGHKRAVCGLSYHPKEECLLSCSVDGTIKLWK
jgi:mitogen-activated protein kinase organizer 1